MNAQTDTGAAQFKIGDLVALSSDGLDRIGRVSEDLGNTFRVDVQGLNYFRKPSELTLVERKQERTREGGKERTAAAGSASRDFHVGDRVAFSFCGARVGGEVVRVVDGELDLYKVRTGNVETYRNGPDLTPIEPAPEFIEAAVLDDEPIELGDVDPEDALIAASLDAATLLVRICAADSEPLFERVTLNGVTWIVEVRKAQDTPNRAG